MYKKVVGCKMAKSVRLFDVRNTNTRQLFSKNMSRLRFGSVAERSTTTLNSKRDFPIVNRNACLSRYGFCFHQIMLH